MDLLRPPVAECRYEEEAFWGSVLCGPGGDLLSRVLRQSTIGAKAFDGRVRDGIGSGRLARATRPAKDGCPRAVLSGPRGRGSKTGFGSGWLSHPGDKSNQVERAISTGQLHALLRFHIRPIDVVVFHGSDGDTLF